MRKSLTGLDAPIARRLQLALMPMALQFIWLRSEYGLEMACYGMIALYTIIATLVPSALAIWWLIRRIRHWIGKPPPSSRCRPTTLCNWLIVLSAVSVILVDTPYTLLAFMPLIYATLAALVVFIGLTGLDLLLELREQLARSLQRKKS